MDNTQFILSHTKYVAYCVRKLAWENESVEDITQDILLKLLRLDREIREDGVRAFIQVVVKHHMIDSRKRDRAKCRYGIHVGDDFGTMLKSSESATYTLYLEEVRKYIEKSNSKYKKAVIMLAEGYSYKELEEFLEIPSGNIRLGVMRFREKMKKDLGY